MTLVGVSAPISCCVGLRCLELSVRDSSPSRWVVRLVWERLVTVVSWTEVGDHCGSLVRYWV